MTVYIIGAGPGDPELITLKGARLVERCPLVLYTGSLVPKDVVALARPDARVIDSAGMNLDEIVDLMVAAHEAGEDVARVHTGDPSLFGSTAEQVRRLAEHDITCEIVPGVSSFTAAAAAVGQELTLPELTQTVIVTRVEGRTPMPEREQLAELGRHGATMALFLSAGLVRKVEQELTPHYGVDCPVVVVQRASWPDQLIVRTTLGGLVEAMQAAGIRATAMILIGPALGCTDFAESRLYAADFTHRFRRGVSDTEDAS